MKLEDILDPDDTPITTTGATQPKPSRHVSLSVVKNGYTVANSTDPYDCMRSLRVFNTFSALAVWLQNNLEKPEEAAQ